MHCLQLKNEVDWDFINRIALLDVLVGHLNSAQKH